MEKIKKLVLVLLVVFICLIGINIFLHKKANKISNILLDLKTSLVLSKNKDIELNKIYYKSKFRENFDTQYLNAIQNEERLSISDELNILYVALTRAKYNLIILKKSKQSVFDILNYDFSKREIGQLYIDKDDNNLSKDIDFVEYTPLQLGLQNIQQKDTLDTKENIKAKYIGLATHYCLEMMRYFDKESLSKAIDITKAKYFNFLDSDDFIYIDKIISNLIVDKEFNSLISNNTYTKEQELIYENNIKIIDLLIKGKDSYIVVDYKTTNDIQQSHINQVKDYTKAISGIFHTNTIGYLVYLQKHKIQILKV